jgi:hypothetical protein
MSLSQLFEAIDRFFLDIIGTIIPGAAVICGLWIVFEVPDSASSVSLLPPTELFDWVLFIVGSYVAGHAVISVGEKLVLKIFDNSATRWAAHALGLKPTVFEEQLLESIEESADYRAVVDQARERYRLSDLSGSGAATVYSWRNIALSIAQDNSYLAWRFMFISQLNLGMATAALILVGLWILSLVPRSPLEVSVSAGLKPWVFTVLVVVSVLFLERRHRFYEYSMRVPFSMAVVQLHETKADTASAGTARGS